MKLQIFSVYDKAVQAYLAPFFARSKGEALRSFADACNKEDTNFNKYGADYHLVYLGEYDDQSGDFACVHPVKLVTALECKLEEPFTEDNKVKRLPM